MPLFIAASEQTMQGGGVCANNDEQVVTSRDMLDAGRAV